MMMTMMMMVMMMMSDDDGGDDDDGADDDAIFQEWRGNTVISQQYWIVNMSSNPHLKII